MGYTGQQFANLEELCDALSIPPGELLYVANNVGKLSYEKEETKEDGSPRYLTAPKRRLKEIQKRLKELFFTRFIYPDYVYGLGGTTLRQHAETHSGSKYLIQVDLRDFFPSVSHDQVYEMWVKIFGLTPRLAGLLTKLTTTNYKLQQGFPTSSHIAAIVALPMTGRLDVVSKDLGLKFSQYVDDLNFSGPSLDYRTVFKHIVQAAHDHGFAIKARKTRVRAGKTGKVITGVSLYEGRIRAPRYVRKRAIDALKSFESHPDDLLSQKRVDGYARFLSHLSREDGQKYRTKAATIRGQVKK